MGKTKWGTLCAKMRRQKQNFFPKAFRYGIKLVSWQAEATARHWQWQHGLRGGPSASAHRHRHSNNKTTGPFLLIVRMAGSDGHQPAPSSEQRVAIMMAGSGGQMAGRSGLHVVTTSSQDRGPSVVPAAGCGRPQRAASRPTAARRRSTRSSGGRRGAAASRAGAAPGLRKQQQHIKEMWALLTSGVVTSRRRDEEEMRRGEVGGGGEATRQRVGAGGSLGVEREKEG